MTSDGSFYMTLPSNTNRQTNRPGNFTIELPERLYMNQYWKVALVNLIYANVYNQDEGAYLVYAEMGNPDGHVYAGHFHLPRTKQLSTSRRILQTIHDELARLADHQGIDLAEFIVILNNGDNAKLTTIELKKEAKLGFSIPLAIALGFLTPQLSFKSYQ